MSLATRVFVLFSLLFASVYATQGDLFNFVPGLGACGFTNTSSQFVGSVSAAVFNNYPNATANPNDNPICTHNLTVTSGGKNVSVQIVDYFTMQGNDDNVGFSTSAFQQFADTDQGIVYNVTWTIV